MSEIRIESIDLADVQNDVREAEVKALEGLKVTLPLLALKKLLRLAKIGQETEERRARNGNGGVSWALAA